MKNIYKTIVILLLIVPAVGFGQKALLREANELYNDRAYFYAADAYEKFLAKRSVPRRFSEKEIIEVKTNLATSYRLIKNTVKAAEVYTDLINNHSVNEPDILYYFASMLQANGSYKVAKEQYIAYKKAEPNGRVSDKFLNDLDKLMDASANKYPENNIRNMYFNSEASDYGTAWLGGKLVFASTRGTLKKDHSMWSGEAFSELYTYDGKTVEKLPKQVNSALNEGAVTFSPDEETMYFTRNFFIKGKEFNKGTYNYLAILESKLQNGKWNEGKKMPFCDNKFNNAHPTLSADGETMFFASDRDGGQGQMDIYMVQKSGGKWGTPINLGEEINTKGNEIFPYIHGTDSLYFASDGHAGYGGLDVFLAINKNGKWEVTNVKKPVNSSQDDFGFVWVPNTSAKQLKTGYVTSNREGNDNIYQVRRNLFLVGTVADEYTKQPIDDATIILSPTSGNIGNSDATGSSFDFHINTNYNYRLTVGRKGYLTKIINLTEEMYVSEAVNDTIHLDVLLNNITFKCIVYDDSIKRPLRDVEVKLSGGNDSTAITNEKGWFDFIAQPGKSFNLRFSKEVYKNASEYLSAEMLSNWNFYDTLKVYMQIDTTQDVFVYINILDELSRKPLSETKVGQYQYFKNHELENKETQIDGTVWFRFCKAYQYEVVASHPFFSTKTLLIDFNKEELQNEDTLTIVIPPPAIHGTIVDHRTEHPIDKTRIELFESEYFGEIKITKGDGKYHFYMLPDTKYKFGQSYPFKLMHNTYFGKSLNLFTNRVEQEVVTDKGYSFPAYIVCADTVAINKPKSVNAEAGKWQHNYEAINIPLVSTGLPEPDSTAGITLAELYNDLYRGIGSTDSKPEIAYLFGNIYFDIDKDKLREETQVVFDSLHYFLTNNPEMKLRITAFADSTGRIMHNLDLSKRRANSARDELIKMGINPSRIFIYYYGEEPIEGECPAPVENPACLEDRLQFSRRVEFKIVKTSKVNTSAGTP